MRAPVAPVRRTGARDPWRGDSPAPSGRRRWPCAHGNRGGACEPAWRVDRCASRLQLRTEQGSGQTRVGWPGSGRRGPGGWRGLYGWGHAGSTPGQPVLPQSRNVPFWRRSGDKLTPRRIGGWSGFRPLLGRSLFVDNRFRGHLLARCVRGGHNPTVAAAEGRGFSFSCWSRTAAPRAGPAARGPRPTRDAAARQRAAVCAATRDILTFVSKYVRFVDAHSKFELASGLTT